MANLLTEKSAKIDKSNISGLGYLERMLYLAPASISGFNVCPQATEGCKASCIFTSGHGRYPRTQQARINRTHRFFNDREQFLTDLKEDIEKFEKKCDKLGQRAAIRLNGMSDLPWEKLDPSIFSDFPNIQFYDYTKITSRMFSKLPKNYHLTYSRSEYNWDNCLKVLRAGKNVAMVFDWPQYTTKFMRENWLDLKPTTYQRFKVADGETHDYRFLNKGLIGLYAKGRGRYDKTGFVVKQSV